MFFVFVFFFKQKTAYEMRISDWSSDVCSSDLRESAAGLAVTGLKAEGVACCRPVAEIRDGTHQHHISHRTRPSRSLSIHYRQDHHRTGGRPRPLGSALGHVESLARYAA